MNRSCVTIIVLVLLAGTWLIPSSFAQGMNESMGKDMMKSGMMCKGEMMEKCPIHGMGMKGIMEKSMIASADGGVIVLAGNKLTKYDKDLNVVKEVEIKIDIEAMQKNMMEMMKNCPMMKGAVPPVAKAEEKTGQKK